MTDKLKIKPFNKDNLKAKGLDGKGVDIKLDDKNAEVELEKKDKNEKTKALKVKWKKDGTQDWKDAEVELEYDGNWFFDGAKIPKNAKVGDATLEEDVSLGVKGGYKMGFWITLVAILLLIGGLIWWWIASSKKEDKEEEAGL